MREYVVQTQFASVDAAKDAVAAILGVAFEPHESSFVGECWVHEVTILEWLMNGRALRGHLDREIMIEVNCPTDDPEDTTFDLELIR